MHDYRCNVIHANVRDVRMLRKVLASLYATHFRAWLVKAMYGSSQIVAFAQSVDGLLSNKKIFTPRESANNVYNFFYPIDIQCEGFCRTECNMCQYDTIL